MEREQLHREKQLREEAQKEKEELQQRMQELQEQFHATQEAMVCFAELLQNIFSNCRIFTKILFVNFTKIGDFMMVVFYLHLCWTYCVSVFALFCFYNGRLKNNAWLYFLPTYVLSTDASLQLPGVIASSFMWLYHLLRHVLDVNCS